MTLEDARRRSDFQVEREDPQSLVPIRLVTFSEASSIAQRAFSEGYVLAPERGGVR
jgi:hypothetical protein